MAQKYKGGIRYRGWTLVDVGRSRFASKDGTSVMRRVCRENDPQEVAMSSFRQVVDREEDQCQA
jgi:hypothetical protein